jgi:hypothetical protein
MNKKEIHKRIKKIRQEDKEVRFQGLLDKITDYLQNPSEEKREKLRLFVQVAVSPEELLEFFLDNLKTLDDIRT